MTDTQEATQTTRTSHAGENGWRKQSTEAMVDVAPNGKMGGHPGHDRLGEFDRLRVISYIQAS